MTADTSPLPPGADRPKGLFGKFLDWVEWAGNKLPDPALLFVWVLFITWALSLLLAPIDFGETDPRSLARVAKGELKEPEALQVKNQLEGHALARFFAGMVDTFVRFPPLGVVLVALLGVGVAEHTGLINAIIKWLLGITPARLLTPMLLLVAIVSHTAGDTGYVLVIPLGGVIFAAAGRHPLAGIACAFAGVAGGFSANFIPSGLDALLQGFTQPSAQFIDPAYRVNILCNWFFMSASCLLIVGVGWFITDRIVEPRLRHVPVDAPTAPAADPAAEKAADMSNMGPLTPAEKQGLIAALAVMAVYLGLLAALCVPENSPLRDRHGSLTAHDAPLMRSIIPIIFLVFLVPGIVYGYVAGTVSSHRDIFKGMARSMSTMGYYLVLAFFAALFTYSFAESNLGALLAVKGAKFLAGLGVPPFVLILGIILLSTTVNLLIGSASAKWAILGPVFVPMMMQLGLSPELTQAAYRIGDSSTNIITPLLPYFPLIVVYAQRYVKATGVGTIISLTLPYSICFITTWTVLLMIFWALGLPLGIDAPYTYMPGQ